jgi:hypothetical protein
MRFRKQIFAVLLALTLIPAFALAQEKKATVAKYDEGSQMLTVKGKDWEQSAKVGKTIAAEKKDLLKEGSKVTVEFDDRGGGDIRIKSLNPR